ncbi:MAG: hypothetical protein HZC37_03740 [Burkholderiales bacterium]|nr:hypothetical protein [Burkholderiales bacterium]
MAFHDVAHVLAENDITPLGEIQQARFQGGHRREDGFFFDRDVDQAAADHQRKRSTGFTTILLLPAALPLA